MDVVQMLSQYVNFGTSIYREGFLDGQFTQLQLLSDEDNSTFLVDVISAYARDSDKILNDMTKALENPVQFDQVVEMAHTLKGSSSSIGLKKVTKLCISLRMHAEKKNLQEGVNTLHELKQEYGLAKNKLETLAAMQREIMAAGGVVPVIE